MAKVLLINPPSETLGPENLRITNVLYPPPPGGIALVAACLEQAGHKVTIEDLVIAPRSEKDLLDAIATTGVDAVGFSVLGPAFYATRQMMRSIRTRFSKIRLFAGNALPSEFPEWFLNEVPECDVVIVGEGEATTVELIENNFASGTAGAMLQGDESFRPRPQLHDLDALPFPAWHLLPYRQYRASPQLLMRSEPTLGIIQSRGCPFSCGFCAQNFAWKKVRKRSVESVADEIARNARDLDIHHFGLYDSIFPLEKDYGEKLYHALEHRNLLGRVRFFCETRVDMVWPSTFEWLQKAGLHLTFLGIESPKENLLAQLDKKSPEVTIRKAVNTLREAGIRTYGLFMIGLPGETAVDREALGRFSRSLSLDVASFGIYSQYAGSPGVRSNPEIRPEDLLDGNWQMDGELGRAQKDLMRSFYLRPSLIARHLWQRDIKMDRMFKGFLQLLPALPAR
ncbi:MAG: B12-binding domain-containing radical SAM protein [Deltaproteobacteria bacterium]|nr:B12-binding domain-containing radical SAM protein [Deltaproteobacteria bacterium]